MVQTDISSIVYVGNVSTTAPYPVPFNFFRDEDLIVIVKDNAGLEDIQVLNTDYTVIGAGDPNGGSITLVWAVPATSTVTIFRAIDATQLTAYEEADSFPAKSHERALDKLTMLVQQALRVTGEGGPTDLGRAFRLSEASEGISSVAKVNDTMLGIDVNGNAILRTEANMLAWLGQVGTVWANTAERVNTRGAFPGQLGVQLDNFTIYIANSTTPGDWKPFLIGSGIIGATDGIPHLLTPPAGDLVGTIASQVLTNKTIIAPTLTNPTGITKVDVGLDQVDNVRDKDKPASDPTLALLSTKQDLSQRGLANGYPELDATGKVPATQLPASSGGGGLIYKGSWNAATNTPAIPAASAGNNGWFYVVSVAGTTNIDGINTWAVGDWITSNGTIWQKIPQTDAVSSVNGRTGAVVVNKTDVLLGNCDNTSDATKNAATATLTNKTIDGANNTLTVRLGNDVTGNLPVNRLNNGTGAGAGTYWRGDGSWAAPSGTGDVSGPALSTDGEIPVFNGATGKLIRRYSGGTGYPKFQTNAAPTILPSLGNADIDATLVHNQTEKTSALVDADEFLVWDSSVPGLRKLAASRVRYLSGETVQTIYTELKSEIVTALEILPPFNITKGIQILTADITLKYPDSKVLLTASGTYSQWSSPVGAANAIFMAFIVGTTLSLGACCLTAYGDGLNLLWSLSLMHTPGTAGAKTYTIRMANQTSATATYSLYANGFDFVSGNYLPVTSMTLQEIKA